MDIVENADKLDRLRDILAGSDNIVFFGGAGVSTESGIPDFRGKGGLYSQEFARPPEQILSRSFFDGHPEEFFAFYRARVLALHAKPGPAHLALARLEAQGRLRAAVTQNIDGLHQAAGSKTVFELHGSVHRNACLWCGRAFDAAFVHAAAGVPRCGCGGVVKPDVVLYGEELDPEVLRGATRAIAAADVLVVGGTSLAVYPAAGLLDYFAGRQLVVINLEPTGCDAGADLVIDMPIGPALGYAMGGGG